jgi:glycerol-1-phosphate dehydrogenase [NAD(P)+]
MTVNGLKISYGHDEKWMQLPRNVVIGPNVVDLTGDVLDSLGLKGPSLIVCDSITRGVAAERVQKIISERYTEPKIVEVESADIETVKRLTSMSEKEGIAFLMGVGGGKCIDMAKLAAMNVKRPFLSVPTAASHDGIASARASVRVDGESQSIQAESPLSVIADTRIMMKAPFRLLASGCADIISNVTAVLDWQLASRLKDEYYSDYAGELSKMTAVLMMNRAHLIKPNLEESVRLTVKALVSSSVAMSIAGSSRPASGAEHLFSHTLDNILTKPALHGEQCGVGAIMMMYLHGGDWEGVRDALSTIGAPTTANDMGINDEDIIKALTMAHRVRNDRYTILGDSGLTDKAAEHIARATGVIN